MDLLKLEEFVEYFNIKDFQKCNFLLDEAFHSDERKLAQGMRKVLQAMEKVKSGNYGGAAIPLKEAMQDIIPFRHLIEKHIPGFTGKMKRVLDEKAVPKLEFRG